MPLPETGRQWPELQALDESVSRLDRTRAQRTEPTTTPEEVQRVLAHIEGVLNTPMPADVEDPEAVREKFESLRTLSGEIRASMHQLEAAPLGELRPLVTELQHAAGVPHTHEHSNGLDDPSDVW